MEKNLKNILNQHNFTFKKAYGQNFLTDKELLEGIVTKAGVDKNTTVLEIGCGAGALTLCLAKKAKKVYGYEIDTKLKPILENALSEVDNIVLTFNDVMKEKVADIEKKIGCEYMVVANLPYYITTPVIMNFLENAVNMRCMTIMVQKEVALRLSATPGSADYGAITVAINLRGNASLIAEVDRTMFTPMPNVDSAVVKIDIDSSKYKGVDQTAVRDAVRCAFSSRRKMLVNNIMNVYKLKREQAESVLTNAGLKITVRGEKLSAEDFIKLSEELKRHEK